MDIEVLVERSINGDKEALIDLIMRQKDSYYRLAMLYLSNEADALDAVQDMTLSVYHNIKALKKKEAFYSWSKTILVNICKKTLKRNRKVIALDDWDLAENDRAIENVEHVYDIEKAIMKLSLKHREIIRMRYDLELSYEEIAIILKIPLGTVKSRINKGLERLKIELEGGK